MRKRLPNGFNISRRFTFQGAIEHEAMIGGTYFHIQYMGYTQKEALRMFKAACLQKLNNRGE